MSLRIVADDLTGAADSAVAFTGGGPVPLLLDSAESPWTDPLVPVVAVDVDSRTRSAEEAHQAVLTPAAAAPPGATLFKKIDSLLRGHVEAECRAVRRARPGHLLVVAPSFPGLGRAVAGPRVVEALGSIACTVAPLHAVRDSDALVGAIHAAAGALVCEAETDGDLDAVVGAVRQSGVAVTWVGAGGLAAALARPGTPPAVRGASGRVLAVVGSTVPLAREQAAHLEGRLVELPVASLVDGGPVDLSEALEHHATVVVTIAGERWAGHEQRIAASLARAVGPAGMAADVLVLCGGATARAVLETCGVRAVRLLGELEPGVVASRADGLRALVITKSGSFGDARTLARVVRG